MFNPDSVKTGSSGKYLNVEVSVIGNYLFVKMNKNGEQ